MERLKLISEQLRERRERGEVHIHFHANVPAGFSAMEVAALDAHSTKQGSMPVESTLAELEEAIRRGEQILQELESRKMARLTRAPKYRR